MTFKWNQNKLDSNIVNFKDRYIFFLHLAAVSYKTYCSLIKFFVSGSDAPLTDEVCIYKTFEKLAVDHLEIGITSL